MNGLREYLKLKYSAPDCKCGNCQLVPPEVVARYADLIDELTEKLRLIHTVSKPNNVIPDHQSDASAPAAAVVPKENIAPVEDEKLALIRQMLPGAKA